MLGNIRNSDPKFQRDPLALGAVNANTRKCFLFKLQLRKYNDNVWKSNEKVTRTSRSFKVSN